MATSYVRLHLWRIYNNTAIKLTFLVYSLVLVLVLDPRYAQAENCVENVSTVEKISTKHSKIKLHAKISYLHTKIKTSELLFTLSISSVNSFPHANIQNRRT